MPAVAKVAPAPAESSEDAFSALIAESVAQSLVPSDDTEETVVPDEEGSPETTPEAKEPETKDAPLPDGMVAIPKSEGQLATEFKVSDAEGEIESPALMIDFMANGKARKEPLDKVVKLAQWGVYNHERHQQAEAAFHEAQAAKETMAELQQQVAETRRAVEEMLSSDDAYLAAREVYDKQNTPEARMAAREQALATERDQMEYTSAQSRGQDFFENRVTPALEMIAKNLPSVTEEELAAKVLLVANRFTVNTPFGSIVHPDAHQQIAEAITTDLLPWAQQVHDARQADRKQVSAEADQKVSTARVETQKAKNLVAKAIKPAGRTAPESKTRPAPRNADEAHDEVLRATFEAMGMR